MGADVNDARWRIKTAAIAIVLLVLTPVLGSRWELRWIFLLPVLLAVVTFTQAVRALDEPEPENST